MSSTAIRRGIFTSAWPSSIDVHRWVLGLLIGWTVLGCALQLHLVLRDTLVNSVDLLFDDAYYYLGIAHNVASGHGSRFAEPLATNGYHPLWLLILTALTALFDLSKQGLVCATLVLTAAIKCLGIWWFDHGGTSRWRQTFGRVGIFVAIVKFPFVFSYGMETTLFVVLIPWLLRIARQAVWSRSVAWQVGLACSTVFLTRIDALSLCAVVLLLAVATRRASVKAAAVAALPLLLTVAIYAVVNQALFGTPLPVSGQAKSIGAHFGGNFATTLDALAALRWSGAMLALWLLARATVAPHLRIDGFELLALAITAVVCGVYYGVMSNWPIWPWYRYPSALLSIYAAVAGLSAVAAFVDALAAQAGRHFDARDIRRGVAVVGVACAAVYLWNAASGDHLFRGRALSGVFDRDNRDAGSRSFNQQNVALVPWLQQTFPGGARLAMGDRAGGLGYWMPRQFSMIHTEGLVADFAFLRTLRTGMLEQDLVARGVDLYVTDRPRAVAAGPVLAFVEPVQPRSLSVPLNVLCFRDGDELLRQDYSAGGEPQIRRVFAMNRRVDCPAPLLSELHALQTTYDGIRKLSGF